MSELGILNLFVFAENDHGYKFGVFQLGGQWQGFAAGRTDGGEVVTFLLPGCGESDIWNLLDENEESKDFRSEIIRRTGAAVQDPERGYGGIARWFVEESLRGMPDDFRCEQCGGVCCPPDAHDFDFVDYL